jgi:hypothetical protein
MLLYSSFKQKLGRHPNPSNIKGHFKRHAGRSCIEVKKEVFQRFNSVEFAVVNIPEESFEQIENKIMKDIDIALSQNINLKKIFS